MPNKINSVATSILTLLNNIDELIVLSSDRQNARDVMEALTIYAASQNFLLPIDKVENFYSILLDARPQTISFIVKDIAGDVIQTSQKKES